MAVSKQPKSRAKKAKVFKAAKPILFKSKLPFANAIARGSTSKAKASAASKTAKKVKQVTKPKVSALEKLLTELKKKKSITSGDHAKVRKEAGKKNADVSEESWRYLIERSELAVIEILTDKGHAPKCIAHKKMLYPAHEYAKLKGKKVMVVEKGYDMKCTKKKKGPFLKKVAFKRSVDSGAKQKVVELLAKKSYYGLVQTLDRDFEAGASECVICLDDMKCGDTIVGEKYFLLFSYTNTWKSVRF